MNWLENVRAVWCGPEAITAMLVVPAHSPWSKTKTSHGLSALTWHCPGSNTTKCLPIWSWLTSSNQMSSVNLSIRTPRWQVKPYVLCGVSNESFFRSWLPLPNSTTWQSICNRNWWKWSWIPAWMLSSCPITAWIVLVRQISLIWLSSWRPGCIRFMGPRRSCK